MSKDKGTKNTKKAAADKTSGKTKHVSAYKSEGSNEINSQKPLDVFAPKPEVKNVKKG